MYRPDIEENLVVICFHFSNFEPLETAAFRIPLVEEEL